MTRKNYESINTFDDLVEFEHGKMGSEPEIPMKRILKYS